MAFDRVIINNLLHNKEYARKVIPFLREEYFHEVKEKIIFSHILEYVKNYNSFPSIEALKIDLQNNNTLNEQLYKDCSSAIDELRPDDTELEWLIDNTEKFCQDKALFNALMQSIQIVDEKNSNISKGAIPQLLTEALAVSFDSHIGHDFFEDSEERYEFYHKKEKKVPFDLDYFNRITKGGISTKTLSIIMAGCVHPDTKVKIRYRKRN